MYELFEEKDHYEIVMDACKGGDLCDEIDRFGAIAEVGASLILHQVLTCVNYCHQRHIVHCDLKVSYIYSFKLHRLWDSNYVVVVCTAGQHSS